MPATSFSERTGKTGARLRFLCGKYLRNPLAREAVTPSAKNPGYTRRVRLRIQPRREQRHQHLGPGQAAVAAEHPILAGGPPEIGAVAREHQQLAQAGSGAVVERAAQQ